MTKLKKLLITFFSISILSFIISCNYSTSKKVVALQPFTSFPTHLIDTLKSTIEHVYDFDVIILPKKELPKSAFVNLKSPRYRADSLIRILKKEIPDSVDYILGLTSKDISTTKRSNGKIKEPAYKYSDWGIMGLGFRPGVSCVLSTHQIKGKNFIERLTKIAMHELGHNLGLKHCTYDQKCVMRDAAETVKTIDEVDLKLCNHCKSRIY